MRKPIGTVCAFGIGLAVMICGSVCMASGEAPPQVVSALVLKLAPLEKGISGATGDVTIHVIGSPDIAAALSKAKGTKIGGGTLKAVTENGALPASTPSIIILADASMQADVTAYAKKNKVLSVTSIPDLVAKGIALGMGLGADGKPEVFLNPTASKEAGLNWNPAIFKIAKTTK